MNEEKKSNQIFILKRIGQNLIIEIIVFVFLMLVFKHWYNNVVSFKNNIFRLGIAILSIYIIYKNYKNYKYLSDVMDRRSLIMEIKRYPNAKERLNSLMIIYEKMMEINKTKLDILKSLTPVSIVIFLLGLIINGKITVSFKEIFVTLKMYNKINLNLEQTVILMIIFILIYYIYEFRNTWLKYKNAVDNYYEIKNELEFISDFFLESSH